MKYEPELLENSILHKAHWLTLNKIKYRDFRGIQREWESVSRLKCDGAIALIAILKPSDRIILLRQYRPPAGGYVIEFPAGLIDPGESPEKTAERELLEESGYKGKVARLFPPVYNSPGLTGESVYLAEVLIDENDPDNHKVAASPEGSEDITTHLIPINELNAFLEERKNAGDMLDAKLASFALPDLLFN